jgi:hypothetical protein
MDYANTLEHDLPAFLGTILLPRAAPLSAPATKKVSDFYENEM